MRTLLFHPTRHIPTKSDNSRHFFTRPDITHQSHPLPHPSHIGYPTPRPPSPRLQIIPKTQFTISRLRRTFHPQNGENAEFDLPTYPTHHAVNCINLPAPTMVHWRSLTAGTQHSAPGSASS